MFKIGEKYREVIWTILVTLHFFTENVSKTKKCLKASRRIDGTEVPS